ncbi:MAG: hypothetical protein ACLQDY_29330 [Streptosporangiaceae bacterium]
MNTHISAAMRSFTDARQGWLTVVRLPAYAPDLNPAEGGCSAEVRPGLSLWWAATGLPAEVLA